MSPSLSTNSIPELSASSDNFSLTEETDTGKIIDRGGVDFFNVIFIYLIMF